MPKQFLSKILNKIFENLLQEDINKNLEVKYKGF